MAYCFVAGPLGPECPAATIARGLAGLGLEVHLILPNAPAAEGVAERNVCRVYVRHSSRSPGIRSRILWRRNGLARLLRAIGPEVVHCGPEAVGFDGGVVRGHRPIVLRSVSDSRPISGRCDAGVLPDGRLVDRGGRPLATGDLPPRPGGTAVLDGIDPALASRHWGLFAFLSGVDHLRRSRRVRRDGPATHARHAPRGLILRESVGGRGSLADVRP